MLPGVMDHPSTSKADPQSPSRARSRPPKVWPERELPCPCGSSHTFQPHRGSGYITSTAAKYCSCTKGIFSRKLVSRESKRPLTGLGLPVPGYIPREEAHWTPITAREAHFRHSGWARQRLAVAVQMHRTNPNGRAYYLFANCGAMASLVRDSKTGEPAVRAHTCKHRMCSPCRRRVASIVRFNLAEQCKKVVQKHGHHALRAVTLTLTHSNAPLREQITRLLKSFRTLRRRKRVRQFFKGGSYVLEIKVSSKDGRWHPHLHILTEGTFLRVEALSDEWKNVTKDSQVVWIKAVPDVEQAIAHDTKYITKATDNSVFAKDPKLAEFITATKGVRSVGTFGSWRGVQLKRAVPSEADWQWVAPLEVAMRLAERGDQLMRDSLAYLDGKSFDPLRDAYQSSA